MKPVKSHTRKSTRPNFKANLLMTLLVIGVPIGTKLILLNARAASSEQIKITESMVVPRYGHTNTVYADGRVLISGGYDRDNNPVATQEVFDPTNHTFHVLAPNELDDATI